MQLGCFPRPELMDKYLFLYVQIQLQTRTFNAFQCLVGFSSPFQAVIHFEF